MKYERLVLGSILTLILILLCYNYASIAYYAYSPYNENPDNYLKDNMFLIVKNHVFIMATVTEVNDDGFIVSIYKNRNIEYYQIKTPYKEDVDSPIVILGTLSSNNEIIANIILPRSGTEFAFVILRSIFGLFLFLLIFRKYWKFNLKKMRFIGLKEKRACKSERFAASKSKLEKNATHFSSIKNRRFFKVLTVFLNHKILKKILRRK